MFETGAPILRPPQALQFNAHALTELQRALQPYLPLDQAQVAVEPATAAPVVEAPRVSSAEFNRVLWTAESMIASVMGLRTCEVGVFVTAGRYVF